MFIGRKVSGVIIGCTLGICAGVLIYVFLLRRYVDISIQYIDD